MGHVIVIEWSDERHEENRTCTAVCECGWRSTVARNAAALRTQVLVHRLANVDTVTDALAVGLRTLAEAAAPVVQCRFCGRSQLVRAAGYPQGLTGQELIDIGWEWLESVRGEWVKRPGVWRFQTGIGRSVEWRCPMCARPSDSGDDR